MSTHAEVGIMHGDVCKSIYVHSDGYMEYVGKVLLEHYDSTKANFLVAQGDCSMLGKEIGEKIDFSQRLQYDDDNVAEQCRFYKRDRGDEGCEYKVTHSIGELLDRVDASYVYIMKDGVWYVSVSGGDLKVLSNILKGKVDA